MGILTDDSPKPIELIEHYQAEARKELEVEIITKLLQLGWDKKAIADTVGVSPQHVTNILQIRLNGRVRTPEEEELASEARRLARKALQKAHTILDVGTQSMQMQIIKSILPAAARMIGNDSGSEDEARSALERVFGEQRLDGRNPFGELTGER